MVKHTIKVYARLKREKKQQGGYEIVEKKNHENLLFHYNSLNDKKQTHKFRFHKVFGENCTQDSIYEIVAKPVLNSFLNGYNGTILAYGQTGSGKTYSITGCPKNYNNRGLIPRCIESTFEFANSSPENVTVHISYLEIYNEIAYDLLTTKQLSLPLEDLPRILLLEDGKGEAHLKNLNVIPAFNVQEAMRLLFLGDTNRTIAETASNECSSRSHCIFTLYLSTRSGKTNNKICKRKLNLVDLAGSERIHKTKISGVTLAEAKNINLSLHYLEQVILALSQSKRSHVPFRNSIMTYLLKDSLSGNCMTSMLTTLSPLLRNIEETLSTCKFAQRVALIDTEATINEEIDTENEINELKSQIVEMKQKLCLFEDIYTEELDKQEKDRLKKMVDDFLLNSKSSINVAKHIPQIQFCFQLFKEAYQNQIKSNISESSCNSARERNEAYNCHQFEHNEEENKPINISQICENHEQEFCCKSTCNSCELMECCYKNERQNNSEDCLPPRTICSLESIDTGFNNFGCIKMQQTTFNKHEYVPNYEFLENYTCNNYLDLEVPLRALPQHDLELKEKRSNQSIPNLLLMNTTVSSTDLSKALTNEDKKELRSFHYLLDKKYSCAEIIWKTIEECKSCILKVRTRMESEELSNVEALNSELIYYQNIYKDALLKMEAIKNDTEHLKYGLRQAEIRIGMKLKQNNQQTTCNCKNIIYKKNKNETNDLDVWLKKFANCDNYEESLTLKEKEYNVNLPQNLLLINDNEKQDGSLVDKIDEYAVLNSPDETRNCCLFESQLPEREQSSCSSLNQTQSDNSNRTVESNNEQQDDNEQKNVDKPNMDCFFLENDSEDFKQFMTTIPLTGDVEVDEEIFNFYREKFSKN